MSFEIRQFVQYLNGKIDGRISEIGLTMVTGKCSDWAHYKKLVGEVTALDGMKQDLKEAERNYDLD